MSNPIAESIEYLVECGWKREQAVNLVAAITDEPSEQLWKATPSWIEHCGDSMRYVKDMLESVALGLIEVRLGEDNETWLFKLNENGMKVGKKLTEENTNMSEMREELVNAADEAYEAARRSWASGKNDAGDAAVVWVEARAALKAYDKENTK